MKNVGLIQAIEAYQRDSNVLGTKVLYMNEDTEKIEHTAPIKTKRIAVIYFD
jgi:hypothetical protein